MPRRTTILLDDDLNEKLRKLQAKKIQKKKAAVSFSEVLNDTVRRGLAKS